MGSYQPGRFVFHQMIEQGTVSLTTEAVAQLKSLLSKESNPELGLRVFVSGGGCSGMQYGMAFDDSVRPGDDIIAGVKAESKNAARKLPFGLKV